MRDLDARRPTQALRGLARRTLRPPASRHPVLTVVVPVYNVVEYLPECLDSLLGQTLRELEVIAVDDGSTDASLEVLHRYARQDRRIRVLTQSNSGQGIARNRAVEIARGEFLTFCDADDTVPPAAYAHMVETLRRTGSDFCVGATRRFTHQRTLGVSWPAVHDRDVLGTTIDETPIVMQDIIACNRLFRTEFWRDRVPPFRGHIAYEDHVPMLAAYVRATRFDVLARVTYRWRIREDNTSTGQQKADIENLLDRIAVKEEARELLLSEASPATYDSWVARTLDVDFQPFIEPALAGSDMYRNVLSAACRTMFDRATPAALERIRYRAKVRAWLCATREWAAIVEVDDYFRRNGRVPETRVEEGRLVAVPGPDAAFLDLVPQRLWDLSPIESDVVASLRRAEWRPNGDLHLTGAVHIRALRAEQPPQVEAWLEDRSTGTQVELTVLPPSSDPSAPYGQHEVRLAVSGDGLVAATAALPTSWSLHLRVAQGGVVREGGLHQVVPGSSAVRLLPAVLETAERGALELTPSVGDRGLEVEVAHAPTGGGGPEAPGPGLAVRDVRLTEDAIVVEVDGDVPAADIRSARLRWEGVDLPAEVTPGEDGAVTLLVPRREDRWGTGTPTVPRPASYTLVATLTDGTELRGEPGATLDPLLPATRLGDDIRLELRRRPNGRLGIVVGAPLQGPEASPEGQRVLRASYRAAEGRAPDVPAGSVLFISSGGRTVDGDPLAIDAELTRSRPDLTRYWAVRSHATAVPAGATPLLIGSAAWYDVLRTADVICTDDELEPYFTKRPHQRVLQTFRGRPWKSMGRTLWVHQGLSEERIALEIERRRETWDAIVAPDAAAEELYRAELDVTARVITGGTPRWDGLVGVSPAERDGVRRQVLDRLGVSASPTVVLVAPTYREAFSRRVASAGLGRGVDVDGLARALGPDHLVLLRAHQHDRSEAARIAAGGPALDVTDFPDLTALMHAADVAVLDYSSLRFGWALTGRPAVCLVPDLEAYTRVRPALDEYAPTAPGPLATTTEEVADLVRDLPALARLAEPDLARVNARFNVREDGGAAARVVRDFFGPEPG